MNGKSEKENNQTEKKKRKENGVVTSESVGAVGALFSLFALFILFTGTWIFGDIGFAVKSFLLGGFGIFAYLFLPVLFLAFSAVFIGKRFFSKKSVLFSFITVLLGFLVAHLFKTWDWSQKGYLSACFTLGEGGASSAVPAGWVGGLIVWLITKIVGKTVTAIVLIVLLVLCSLLTFRFITGFSLLSGVFKAFKSGKKPKAEQQEQLPAAEAGQANFDGYSYPQQAPAYPNPTGEAAYGTAAPIRPEYVPVTPQMHQRPGVSLSDDYESFGANISQSAFSPFGATSVRDNAGDREQPQGREFLFGGDPADHFKKNLIYDENARVNQKPAVDPRQPQYLSGVNGNFAPTSSYTGAYENAVNTPSEPVRPEKIVTDRTPSFGEYSSERYAARETPTAFTPPVEEAQPFIRPIVEEPVERAQTPIEPEWNMGGREEPSYPTRERSDFLSVERKDPVMPERGVFEREEQPPQRAEPDFRSIFSPSNPNLFGGREREDTFGRSSERSVIGEDDDLFGDNEPSELTERETRDVFGGRERTIGFGFSEPNEPPMPTPTPEREVRGANLFDDEEGDISTPTERRFEEEPPTPERQSRDAFVGRFGERESVLGFTPPVEKAEKREEKPAPPPPVEKPKPKVIRPYKTAPLDFFDCSDIEPNANSEETETNKRTILDTLEAFKVTDATIASVTYGPTVTRYNVAIPRNISPKKVVSLDQEIAISLYSAKGVNIYPNFEDGAVSIEVPNKRRQFVQLGCMLKDDGYTKSKPTSLTFAMGKDVGNRKIYGDIRKMTHLLVAGASGSGKSVFLRCLIISLIVKYSPADLRLILIDPKKTEFVIYDHLPHLVINEIITETNKVIQSLNWAIGEMNRRYSLFEQKSRSGTYVVNIDEYNANLSEGEEKLPKIVIIVDELADLMLAAKKDIEDRIQNLTQKSRAAGIHMILATQRPSADVITGVIKSNLKTRMAFAVASDVDSRVILDASGAQKLLGMGDMLYTMEGNLTPIRVQSASLESEDAQKVVNFIKANNDCAFDESISAYINNTKGGGADPGDPDAEEMVEDVYVEAVRHIIISGSASISMIQRKCSVGYNKAGKIIEWMEDMGYISAFDGAKARKVLITPEEFEEKYGPLK